jgi:hypothetical protein
MKPFEMRLDLNDGRHLCADDPTNGKKPKMEQ